MTSDELRAGGQLLLITAVAPATRRHGAGRGDALDRGRLMPLASC
jgi:hypothetical protein